MAMFVFQDACTVHSGDIGTAMIAMNTTATISDMALHLVNRSTTGVLSYNVDLTGGSTITNQTVAQWMASVQRKPDVLAGSVEPLSFICDRNSADPVKARSFSRFM
jgi:hypothetical protein